MRLLLLNGTVGVGKTSVAEAVGSLLALDGMPNAVVDMDGLAQAWPAPIDDRFNSRLALRNLEALATNFADHGIKILIVAGVVESRAQLETYRGVADEAAWMCRLVVSAEEGERRLRARHNDEPGLAWHLHRAGELHRILELSALDDAVVDTTGKTISAMAALVLRHFDDAIA